MSIGTIYKTKINECSQPSVSTASASVGSLNQGWKIFGKKVTMLLMYTMQLDLQCLHPYGVRTDFFLIITP